MPEIVGLLVLMSGCLGPLGVLSPLSPFWFVPFASFGTFRVNHEESPQLEVSAHTGVELCL